jgi:catechol 2,3-dioxygenase
MTEHKDAIVRPAFHHVNLKTTRLQEMIDWYGEVVGAEVTFQFPGGGMAHQRRGEPQDRLAALAAPVGRSGEARAHRDAP